VTPVSAGLPQGPAVPDWDPPNSVVERLAILEEAPLNLAEDRFGLVNGGSLDTPLTTAKALLPARGGEILIPSGDYVSSAPPSFDDTTDVTLMGQGGVSGGAQTPTRIIYTGTAARALSARSSIHFKLRDLQLLYSNAGFTGDLVDFGWSAANTDAAHMVVERCYFGGSSGGIDNAASLIRLVKAIEGTFTGVRFDRADYAVRGLTATPGDYSNVMNFNGCTFANQVQRAVAAAGEAWTFNGCDWAALADGSCGAYLQDQGLALGLTFTGCWFGDGSASGNWLHHAGHGLVVKGCRFGNGANGVVLSSGSEGIDISGNTFDTITNGINIAAGCSGNFWPNRFVGVTNPIVDGGTLGNSTLGIVQQAADDEIRLRGRVRATEGIHIMTKAGIPTDADFPTDRLPQTGLIGCVDTTNSRLYIRVGTTWKYAALT
jgi:hypothetical protein